MRFWIYAIFGLVFLLILIAAKYLSNETVFLTKTIFIIMYLVTEIILTRLEDKINWILNPAVLASVLTFLLGYGATNLIFLIPDSKPRDNLLSFFSTEPFALFSSSMDYIILGAVFMWLGYRSNLGIFLFRFMTSSVLNVTRYFRKSFVFNRRLIYTLVFVSIVVRLYAISLGILGYARDPEEIASAASISQYLLVLGALTQYSLLIISINYFSSIDKKAFRSLFIALLLIEVLFGFLSGMKSLVILPFVIPLVAFMVIHKRLKKSFLVLAALAVLIAYLIIEPFRIYRTINPNFKNDPRYIIQMMYDAYILNQQVGFGEGSNFENILFSLLSRNNYMIEVSMAIDYEKTIGLNEHDPDFLSRLYFAPLHAVVPRFIWTSKPVEDTGQWFTKRVLGFDINSATGFTPFGYLYFAGGILLVVVFFFIFGIMQNALFRFIELGPGGIVIFVGLLSSVAIIDTSVNAIFVTWIRFYPLLIILQYFTFKK